MLIHHLLVIYITTISGAKSIQKIQKDAEIAVRQGVTQLILSDKELSNSKLPMPMLLCVGAINSILIEKKLRGYVSINVQSGEAMDTHSFATLIGVGATTINPYLAFDSLYQRHEKKLFGQFSFDDCVERYIKSVNAGASPSKKFASIAFLKFSIRQ